MFVFRSKNKMTDEEKDIIKKVSIFYEMHNNIFVTFTNPSERRQIITKIYKILEYNSFPNLSSSLNDTNDNGLKVYRGISAPSVELLNKYVNDFIKGDVFYGGRASIYGTGIYTVVGSDLNIAQDYASDGGLNTCGVIIESVMKSDTKIIKNTEIDIIRNFIFDKIRKMYKRDSNIEKFLAVLEDDGALASILGYDAIFVEEKGYLVVLNRTKMIVNDISLFDQINNVNSEHKL